MSLSLPPLSLSTSLSPPWTNSKPNTTTIETQPTTNHQQHNLPPPLSTTQPPPKPTTPPLLTTQINLTNHNKAIPKSQKKYSKNHNKSIPKSTQQIITKPKPKPKPKPYTTTIATTTSCRCHPLDPPHRHHLLTLNPLPHKSQAIKNQRTTVNHNWSTESESLRERGVEREESNPPMAAKPP